jgi:ATP-dependent helicase/nuclease subunit A
MTQPIDYADRRRAADDLDKNIIVVAGAGTGKTTILIERLMGLLLKRQVPIERIVALTFTKKAAEEMRDRLQAELRKQLPSEPAQRALDNMTRAAIGTIHSFASDILHLYPLQAGVDPHFQVDKGVVAEGIFEDMWTRWLGRELALTSKTGKRWQELLALVSLDDLKDLARGVASPEVELDNLKKREDLRLYARNWKQELDSLLNNNAVSERAHATGPRLKALQNVFTEAIGGRKLQEADLEAIQKLKAPDAWPDEAAGALRRLIARGLALYRVSDVLIERALETVLPFVQAYRQELRRRGVMPYAGLLVHARDLLRDHPDVRASLKKRYDAFLIDEFQDTDPLQGEILLYLAEDLPGAAAHWKDSRTGEGRLFIVGDPKQSIYHFRGADMAAYEQFCDHIEQQGASRATLSVNFRSHRHILTPVNDIFPSLMVEETFVQPRYIDLVPHDTDTNRPGMEFFVIDKSDSEEKVSAEDMRRREALVIADWIKANVNEKLSFKDIALLFRTSTPFEDYLNVFREKGIPYLAEGEKSFYRRPEVIELLNVLGAIADPNDPLPLLGVLRSPIGALTDKEILELKKTDGFDYRRAPRALTEKLAPLYKQLRLWLDKSATTPLSDLIQDVFEKTWLPVLAAQGRYGDQESANLVKIQRLAHDWAAAEPMTLAQFVDRFNEYRIDERDEGENPLADVQVDAVKIMTLHKAKGLEFPVVFIPNISAPPGNNKSETLLRRDWRGGRVGLRLRSADVVSSTLVAIEDEIERREAAEEVRVFYVGMTRAKERLFLMLNAQARRGSEFMDFLKRSGAWPASRLHIPSTVYPYEKMDMSTRRFKESVVKLNSADVKSALDRFAHWRAEKETLSAKKLFDSPSSYLKEPEKWRVVEDDAEAVERREAAIELGIVSHKILEEWDFATPKKDFKKKLKKATTLVAAQELMEAFLETPAYAHLAGATIVGREIPFFYPNGETVMRGIIDLLYEKDGKLVVADYKTSRSSDSEHYRQQGAAYREAVERALKRPAVFEVIFLRTGERAALT